MNILFICTANKERSRTAEIYFQYQCPQHRFRSAGINKYLSERHSGIYLKRYMLEIADRIICMEDLHKDWIKANIGPQFNHKIEVINLGDTGNFMTQELIDQLNKKFKL